MKKRIWSLLLCAALCLVLAAGLLPGKATAETVLPTVTFRESQYVTYGGEAVQLVDISGDLEHAYVSNGNFRLNLQGASQSKIDSYCKYNPTSMQGAVINLQVGYADGSTVEVPHEGWEMRTDGNGSYAYYKKKTFYVKNYPYALPTMALGTELLYNGQPQAVTLPALTWRPDEAVATGDYAAFTVRIADSDGKSVPYDAESGTVTVLEPGTYHITYTFDPATRKNAEWWCVWEDKTGENGWQQADGLWHATDTIRVAQPDIADAVVTPAALTYNAQAQTPVLSVKLNGNVLTQGVDYDVTVEAQKNAGTYQVKLTGKGNFIGEKTVDWSIEPADINNAEATGLRMEYNGRQLDNDQVVLSYGGTTLEKNVDYWFYQGNSGAGVGSYKQVIRGKGNFTGSKEVTVEITPKVLTVVDVRVEDKGYDGTTTGKILEVVLDGLGSFGVEVDYAASTAEFVSPEVGQNKTVTGTIYLTGINADNYVAPLTYTTTGNIFNDFYAQQGKEYTVSTNDWTSGDFEVMPAEGYKLFTTQPGVFEDVITASQEGESALTFYVLRQSDGRISNPVVETYKIDKSAPTGGITIGERSWNGFFVSTYDKLTNQDLEMKVTAEDAYSGVEKIEYITSENPLTVEELETITSWKQGDMETVTAEDGKRVIYYARITDQAGNVGYLASNGTAFDTSAPVITGVEDGGMYAVTTQVGIADKNLHKLTVNGTDMTVDAAAETLTIAGDQEAAYEIVAEDAAGNVTVVSVQTVTIASLGQTIAGVTPENVKRDQEQALQDLQETLENVDLTHATEEEKAALQALEETVQALQERLDALNAAVDTDIIHENLTVDMENVTPENKEDLQQTIRDLEQVLENYDSNLEQDEKDIIKDQIDRWKDALQVLEDAQAVQKLIDALPETAEPDDFDVLRAAQAAREAYWALSEHGQSLVDARRLEKLEEALRAYKITEGDGSTWTGEGGLRFTINGFVAKFGVVEVDGQRVDGADYTVKSGSTIVTLKESYLKSLDEGEHTIEFFYVDGDVEGVFYVAEEEESVESPSDEEPNDGAEGDKEAQPEDDKEEQPEEDKDKKPATPQSGTPGTGDTLLPAILALAALSVLGMVVIIVWMKRSRK